MAQIPAVPTLDPVAKPYASPAEFGRGAAVVAGLADTSEDISLEGLELESRMRKAQQHVDTLAAQNELDAAHSQMQDALAKTENSRDVPDILTQAQDNLNSISRRWANSPASVQIQMDADSLRPGMQHLATVRQIDLMGKEFKVSLNHQAEVLTQDYATGRAAGDAAQENGALGAFTQAVQGGVDTGLIGTAEAQETVRQFRAAGQELQIRNAISNPNPEVNQNIFDQMNAHPEKFPDVKPEDMDALKEHAQTAVESHIKHQEWAEGQMAQNTMLRPLINKWTNPATGQFNEDAALGDVADQLRTGKITVTQADVLSQVAKGYAADKIGALKKQDDQYQDEILKDFHDRKYTEANVKLDIYKGWAEQNNVSDHYRSLLTYGDTMQRQDRTEAREEETLNRQRIQEDSWATLGDFQQRLAAGEVFTDTQIRNMTGRGPGKMETQQVDAAIAWNHDIQKDPSYAPPMTLLAQTFPAPVQPWAKTATPTTEEAGAYAQLKARNDRTVAMTLDAWRAEVNANPKEDKLAAMEKVLQPAKQKIISDQIDQIFGVAPTQPGWLSTAWKGVGATFQQQMKRSFGLNPLYFGKQAAPATEQSAPSAAPKAGDIEDGYRFKGGDASDSSNWEKVP